MASATRKENATLDDLRRVEGKAELIAGEVVPPLPTGRRPGMIASRIFMSLHHHAAATGRGGSLQ